MITAEAGNEAKAKQQLQALLAEKAEFPEKEEAAALLKTLK